MTSALIGRAMIFGMDAHEGQIDDSERSYFVAHCFNVYQILELVTDDENLLCAGLLHDTIEDTEVTYDELVREFNKDVADLVMEVTHEELFDRYNNKIGSSFPRLKTKRGITLKFADRLSNLSRMECWDEKRQQHYLNKSKFWYGSLVEKKAIDKIRNYLKDKEKFLKKFNELSDKEKSQVCCKIFFNNIHQPISWHVAWIEILNDTKIAASILKKLKKKKI